MKSYISQVQDKTSRQILNAAWSWIETAAGGIFARQSEIDADAHALGLVGNKEIAFSTIERISREFAGDLTKPSQPKPWSLRTSA